MTGSFSTDNLNKILRQNCFEVFGLPLQYNIDQNTLNNRHQELQKQLHPDKFVGHPDSLLSIKVSAHINDAYSTLVSPLLRAIALLQQKGITLDLNQDKELPTNFLMEQMELYEEIDEAQQDTDGLNKIAHKLANLAHQLSDAIANNFAKNGMDSNFHGNDRIIIEDIKKLAFYNKLAQLVNEKIEESW